MISQLITALLLTMQEVSVGGVTCRVNYGTIGNDGPFWVINANDCSCPDGSRMVDDDGDPLTPPACGSQRFPATGTFSQQGVRCFFEYGALAPRFPFWIIYGDDCRCENGGSLMDHDGDPLTPPRCSAGPPPPPPDPPIPVPDPPVPGDPPPDPDPDPPPVPDPPTPDPPTPDPPPPTPDPDPVPDPSRWRWQKVAGSEMPDDVMVKNDGEFDFCGQIKCGSRAFEVWSSCAVDARGRLICPAAGGHHDRAGNEVYVYDIPRNTWARPRDPDPLNTSLIDINGTPVPECIGPSKGGRSTPGANHHYGGIVYNPMLDELLLLSQGTFCDTPRGASFTNGMTWAMDLRTFESRQQPFPLSSNTTKAAIDKSTGILYIFDDDISWYDATRASYPQLGSYRFGRGEWYSHGMIIVEPGENIYAPYAGDDKRWLRFELDSDGRPTDRGVAPGLHHDDCHGVAGGDECPSSGVWWNGGLVLYQGGRVLRWRDGQLRNVTPSGGPRTWRQTTGSSSSPGGDDQRVYGKFFEWSGGLYAIVNPEGGVYRLIPEGVTVPDPPPTPDPDPDPPPIPDPPPPDPTPDPGAQASFEERCNARGVVLCDPMDTDGPWNGAGELMRNANGSTGLGIDEHGNHVRWWEQWRGYEKRSGPGAIMDTSTKASGSGSLRFTHAPGGASAAGDWATNFSDDLSVTFGPGDTFFVQYRYRPSCEVIYLDCDPRSPDYKTAKRPQRPGPALKMSIVGAGDPRIGESANACSPIELVTSLEYGYTVYGYHACGWYDGFGRTISGSVRKQHGGDYDCRYRPVSGGPTWSTDYTGPNCFYVEADEWNTIMLRYEIAQPQGRNDSNPRSRVTIYGANEGEPLREVIDTRFNFKGGQRYGKFWALPYLTNKDSSDRHAVGFIWYDELIVSTQEIASPR